jgi:allantoate deiminase
MREAGMTVREDAIGNLIGQYPAAAQSSKTFILGSHLDTVRDAGKYDGVLGVLVAVACVQRLRDENRRLPFDLEAIGFSDEEGVHFQTAYLGSGALTGATTEADLKRMDQSAVTLADAIRNFGGNPPALASTRRSSEELLGYAEVHIEQGPVLENRNLAVGVVAGIAGITRAQLTFSGQAGHAGTTPMEMRRDALCAAAEFVTAAENFARAHPGLVATVGEMKVTPGAVNVIPGSATLSLDVRHADDAHRESACKALRQEAERIGAKRKEQLDWQLRAETKATSCSKELVDLMKQAVIGNQSVAPELVSGAGHDAAAMAAIVPVAMLFVRCAGGISHNPAESVSTDDVAVAIEVMSEFLDLVAAR